MIPAEENGLDRELVLFIGRVNDPAWKEQMQWLRKVCELVCCATIPAAGKWLVDASRFPGVVDWHQRMLARPAVAAIMEPGTAETPANSVLSLMGLA